MITFGPVPSRRLGRSLGINNIPPKACSYSCVYCQVGETRVKEIEPRSFYRPEEILAAVESHLEAVGRAGEQVDYLTFVPDGEPTLDRNLGRAIELLHPLGIRIAVISNGSLVWRQEVRDRLAAADWLSLKVDTTDPQIWKQINQPHPDLHLERILDGMQTLSTSYTGELTTETMLLQGVNDSDQVVSQTGAFIARLGPAKAYLAAPIRPAAEAGIHPPGEERINRAFQILCRDLSRVEYLIGYEGNAFASTGHLADDLLSITSVHPLREEAVEALLKKSGGDRKVVTTLVNQGQLKIVEYEGNRFYVRALKQM